MADGLFYNDLREPFVTVAPAAVTLAAGGVTSGSAVMNGTVNPNGAATAAWFEYGATISYGGVANVAGPLTGTSVVAVSNLLAGLPSGVKYHYRLVATNSAGTNFGGDQVFTTLGGPPLVTTLPAGDLTHTGATLNGNVNANGQVTAAFFEYGLTTGYGSKASLRLCNNLFFRRWTRQRLRHCNIGCCKQREN